MPYSVLKISFVILFKYSAALSSNALTSPSFSVTSSYVSPSQAQASKYLSIPACLSFKKISYTCIALNIVSEYLKYVPGLVKQNWHVLYHSSPNCFVIALSKSSLLIWSTSSLYNEFSKYAMVALATIWKQDTRVSNFIAPALSPYISS